MVYEEVQVTIEPGKMKEVAATYSAAWNSGTAETVAGFYATEGHMVINRGEPWQGVPIVCDDAEVGS